MTEPFVGEIKMFGGRFAPAGWLPCDGRLLNISEYTSLYTLIETQYGGDGVSTFALPDLRARIPIGQSPTQPLGTAGGSESVTLERQHVPPHSHPLQATTGPSDTDVPEKNTMLSSTGTNLVWTKAATTPSANLSSNSVSVSDPGTAPISTISPYLVINYIIALDGVYPSRP